MAMARGRSWSEKMVGSMAREIGKMNAPAMPITARIKISPSAVVIWLAATEETPKRKSATRSMRRRPRRSASTPAGIMKPAKASVRATPRAVIPKTRNSFFTFAPTGLRVADKSAEAGHDEAADSDLDQRAVKRDLEKAPAYPGDGDQLHRDHGVGDLQCGLGVADQERESVKSPSYKGRDPGQGAAD